MLKVAMVIGAFFIFVGALLAVSPETLFSGFELSSRSGLYLAAGVRGVFGLVLILAAPVSRFPNTFRVLGGLSLLAAIVLPFIPIDSWAALIQWATVDQLHTYRFAGALIAIFVGSFIVYAAIPKRAEA